VRPKRIILIRHGESESNVDKGVLHTKPDFAVNLTYDGQAQAQAAGKVVRALCDEVESSPPVSLVDDVDHPRSDYDCWFYRSPYYRTRQTYDMIAQAFDPARIKLYEDPRLREQEHTPRILRGHDDRATTEQERDDYGHFYYQFEGGESCANVYDRVSDFLGTLYRDFEKEDFPTAACIVSHGMTNRVLLMRWLKYTVEEFEFLRNPHNCGMYILNLQPNGKYALSEEPRKYPQRNCKY
jgi:broad specificity phosphatase PhoE